MIIVENAKDLVQNIQGLKRNAQHLRNVINDSYYTQVREAIGSEKDLAVEFKRIAKDIFDHHLAGRPYHGDETMNLIQSYFQTRLCTEEWYESNIMSILVVECECEDACGVELDTLVYYNATFDMRVPVGDEIRYYPFNFTVGLDVTIDKLDGDTFDKPIGKAFDLADAILTLNQDIDDWLEKYDSHGLQETIGLSLSIPGIVVDVMEIIDFYHTYDRLKEDAKGLI